MRKHAMSMLAMIGILILSASGCMRQNDPESTTATACPLPAIDSFPSLGYIQNDYMFPTIKSAKLIRNGVSEDLNPTDPRLIQLLNFFSYSYDQGYTAWLQGHIEEQEFRSYLDSECPMIDICFENISKDGNEFSSTPRAVICANCYLLLVDPSQSSWMQDDSIYANLHFPYQEVLYEYYGGDSSEAANEFLTDFKWGDSKFVDFLTYAGFSAT